MRCNLSDAVLILVFSPNRWERVIDGFSRLLKTVSAERDCLVRAGSFQQR